MGNELPIIIPIIFGSVFVLTLAAGVYLYKNDEAFFGPHPDHPSETDGGRSYNRMQIWVVWAHIVFITGLFALLLH